MEIEVHTSEIHPKEITPKLHKYSFGHDKSTVTFIKGHWNMKDG